MFEQCVSPGFLKDYVHVSAGRFRGLTRSFVRSFVHIKPNFLN